MGYLRQFEDFEPKTGDVPDTPFAHLPTIASRARQILAVRSREEIISAAKIADWMMYEYFHSVRENEIERLKNVVREHGPGRDEALRFFRYIPEEGGRYELLPELEDELAISTADDMTEPEALRACIDQYAFDDDRDFPEGQDYEYFAVLALWLIADALDRLKGTFDRNVVESDLRKSLESNFPKNSVFSELIEQAFEETRKRIPEIVKVLQETHDHIRATGLSEYINLSSAGARALRAMEAVCYAEYLRDSKHLRQENSRLQSALYDLSKDVDKRAEVLASKRVSLAAQRGAIKRHAKSKELQELAVSLYLAGEWASVRQAAKQIFPRLEKRGEAMGFRFSEERGEQTVYEWLLNVRKRAPV